MRTTTGFGRGLAAVLATLTLSTHCLRAAPPIDPLSPPNLAGYTHLSLPGASWKLIFSDEFDGTAVEPAKWRPHLPWGGPEHGRWHTDGYASYLTEEDISLSGGMLRLTTRKTETQGRTRTFHYTAGMITTAATFRFVHGYAEVRAKAPMEAGPGLWPAFWTLANGWPPEFDIIELWTGEPRIHQGYCYAKPRGKEWSSYHSKAGPTDFHTYAMEWGPGYVFFFIDGRITHRVYGAMVTNQPQYLLLNSAVCSGKGNIGPTAATRFPNSFDVDYCRVYARPDALPFHNPGFENESPQPWSLSGGASLQTSPVQTGKRSLRFTANSQSAEQKIHGLRPNTRYKLSAWARSNNPRQPICIGAKEFGGPQVVAGATNTAWSPVSVTFTTGPSETTAMVFGYNAAGPGGACDTFTLAPAR